MRSGTTAPTAKVFKLPLTNLPHICLLKISVLYKQITGLSQITKLPAITEGGVADESC